MAQLPVVPLQVNPSASFTPQSIAGLTLWWRYTDLTTNPAVSIWPDVIATNNAINATAGNRPTNSALGVRFDTSKFLKVTNLVMNTNDSFFVIINFDAGLASDHLSGRTAGNAGYFVSGNSSVGAWRSVDSQLSDSRNVGSAVAIDLIYDANATKQRYTNGVVTGVAGPWGSGGTQLPITTTNFGYNAQASAAAAFYFLEFGWYSNQSLTAGDVANIHAYKKRLYGGP